ncbi:MAG: hypothetical protein M1817_005808 [Caeruleum heppii]|nr:MAG: hypothetical protein M1817_005808 [Caeruleum heppii]
MSELTETGPPQPGQPSGGDDQYNLASPSAARTELTGDDSSFCVLLGHNFHFRLVQQPPCKLGDTLVDRFPPQQPKLKAVTVPMGYDRLGASAIARMDIATEELHTGNVIWSLNRYRGAGARDALYAELNTKRTTMLEEYLIKQKAWKDKTKTWRDKRLTIEARLAALGALTDQGSTSVEFLRKDAVATTRDMVKGLPADANLETRIAAAVRCLMEISNATSDDDDLEDLDDFTLIN